MLKKRVKLFRVYINDIDIDVATALARASLYGDKARIFFTPNLKMLDAARRNIEISKLINSSSVNLCDGVGVVLASKIIGKPIQNKVAGIDFGERLLELAEKEGSKVFLLGGEQGVAKRAKRKLTIKYPRLKICGTHHGYFCDEENDSVCEKIEKSNADILIVCRGFPLQEQFVIQNREKLKNIKVIACLGGAFDVWSGNKKRAPMCMQRVNLEWLWRILSEPKRAPEFIKSLPLLWNAVCLE